MTILMISLLGCLSTYAQRTPYVALEIVKVKDGLWQEALFFFENNWKVYRKNAIKQGIISSYQLLINKADSVSNNIILITQYPDSLAYANSVENFQPILEKIRPNGPVHLNEKQRKDFIETVVFNAYKVWIDDKEKRK